MKIAILGTPILNEYLKQLDFFETSKHEITFFESADLVELCKVYAKKEADFDGFLTTGWLVTAAVEKYVGQLTKPIHQIGYDIASYYESLFDTAYKLNDLDFNRAHIDLLDFIPNHESIAYYLKTGTFKNIFDQVDEIINDMSLAQIVAKVEEIEEYHIRLYEEDIICYSITSISRSIPKLRNYNINCVFSFPSAYKVKEAFEELITKISLKQLIDDKSVMLHMTPASSTTSICDLVKVIREFKKETFYNLLISYDEESVSVILSLKELMELTQNKTICPLQIYIKNKTGENVFIGYGISNTSYQALQNAKIAHSESRSRKRGASYLTDQDEYLIGPLEEGQLITVNQEVTPQIQKLAKQLGLSTFTVQKLLSVKGQSTNNQTTSKDLAAYLDISIRNANRILAALLNNDQAVVLYEKQSSTKGRPEKVYLLILEVKTD